VKLRVILESMPMMQFQ